MGVEKREEPFLALDGGNVPFLAPGWCLGTVSWVWLGLPILYLPLFSALGLPAHLTLNSGLLGFAPSEDALQPSTYRSDCSLPRNHRWCDRK